MLPRPMRPSIAPFASQVLGGILVLLALLAAACGGGGNDAPQGSLSVSLDEFSVEPEVEETTNGHLTLNVTNAGTTPHRLVIVKSDFPPSQLPVRDGAVELDKINLEGQLDALAAGATASLEVDLSPGKYVLLCTLVERPAAGSVVSHYEQGMYAGFFVEQ